MKKESPHAVTALHQNTQPAFTPVEGQAMACLIGGRADRIVDAYLIEPAAEHPSFFFLSHISDRNMRVDYLTRPLRADFVEGWLKDEGLADPAGAEWRVNPCLGVLKAGQSLHPALEAA